MLIVRATKKLLDRCGPPTLADGESSTTVLGDWYATALFGRPQIALFVNEATLLPVAMPLAPAATLLTRFGPQLATVLAAHHVPEEVIHHELQQMPPTRLGKTANRSVVGTMNDFSYLAEAWRDNEPVLDLPELSLRLAGTPCGPLFKRHVSPDRELAAYLDTRVPGTDQGHP